MEGTALDLASQPFPTYQRADVMESKLRKRPRPYFHANTSALLAPSMAELSLLPNLLKFTRLQCSLHPNALTGTLWNKYPMYPSLHPKPQSKNVSR